MLNHEQHLSVTQKLTQKQVMTHQLIQSIKLMAIPLVDLQAAIYEEAEKNPALEIVRDEENMDAVSASNNKDEENPTTDTDPFSNSSDPGYQPPAREVADRKQQFLEGAVYREESLYDHLIDQLHLMDIDDVLVSLAERLIWNLDTDGFHREPPELMISKSEGNHLDEVLNIIRELEPMGCGCLNWSESLLIQATIRGDAPELFEKYINQGLPLMEKKKADDVRISLGITQDDWEDLENYIQILNPFPGRLYSPKTVQYIIPDLIVRQEKDEFSLVLNDEVLPVLRVDPELQKIMEDGVADKNTKRYISNYSRQARYFINSLSQRNNTLLKTAMAIVEFQREFFTGGPRFLKPLILKDVAEKIGYHETTVSRITTNKYIQTSWGLFSLKYFFTNSISGSGASGSRISKVAAKEIIKEILDDVGSEKRISDQKICNLLAKRGINLARRTVAKYRKELDSHATHAGQYRRRL